jgi:hypothetical protein
LTALTSLDTPKARQAAMKGTVEDWATESWLAAREAYKEPTMGMRLKSGLKLLDADMNANLPAALRRLDQAGVTLAMVLNDAFQDTR